MRTAWCFNHLQNESGVSDEREDKEEVKKGSSGSRFLGRNER